MSWLTLKGFFNNFVFISIKVVKPSGLWSLVRVERDDGFKQMQFGPVVVVVTNAAELQPPKPSHREDSRDGRETQTQRRKRAREPGGKQWEWERM